ncbi:MAG: PD40 domain-containing protein [Anaerolineae bacterium]|nr:PD40 domain-containing protein [Anaerolineae bacterium]
MIYRLLLLVWAFAPVLQPGGARLPADLFFLDSGGQVWRMAADDSALDAVSPVGVAVTGFDVAPDGAAIAYRTVEDSIFILAPGEAPARIDAEAALPGGLSYRRTVAWSPAGHPVAYAAGAAVRVSLSLSGGAAPLEAGGGPFVDLLWSPGGRYIACGAAGGGWVVYRLGWGALALAGTLEGDNAVAWASDTALLVAPAGGGLRMVALDGGGVRTLVSGEVRVTKPVVEDDTIYYFVHELGAHAPGVLAMQPLAPEAAEPERLGALAFDPGEARWSARGLILTLPGVDGLALVDPVSGETTPIPNTAGAQAWAWNPAAKPKLVEAVSGLPADLYFLAPAPDAASDAAQVWRLDAATGTAALLTTTAAGVASFAVSPDGARLAYVTDGRLMVAAVGDAGALEAAALSAGGASPAFSPDGAILAYADGGVFTVPAAGGAEPFAVIGGSRYLRPRWSPDGTWLLIDIETAQGAVETALLSVTGRGPLRFEVLCSGARWVSGNKVLCWGADGPTKATPGLYLVVPGDPPQVDTLLDAAWSIVDAVYLPGDGTIIFLQGVSAPGVMAVQPVRLAPGEEPAPFGAGGLVDAPRLAPDGSVIAGVDDAGRGVFIWVETGRRVVLKSPGRMSGMVWGNE